MPAIAGLITSLFIILAAACSSTVNNRPPQLIDISHIIPSLVLDIRYHTDKNFVGTPINGYKAPKCLLTRTAATALKRAQKELSQQSMSLKIFDCYRPQRAVNHFVSWAEDLQDTRMKDRFYPKVNKNQLFDKGYIAAKSGHSRGSTVDLTLVKLIPEQGSIELDMGTQFDLFDVRSHTISPEISTQQQNNRLLLKTIMSKYGFINFPKEWWHYTLAEEPYPNDYFDAPVQ